MFTSSTLSTPTLRRTAPEPSPFTPKTNFNKVALSASPAQQQRQGVSSETLKALKRGWGVLKEEINDSQLLGYMPSLGGGFDVGLRSRVFDGMIDTLEGSLSTIQGYYDFLHNGGKGIGNAADESFLLHLFDQCVPPQDRIKPEVRYAPLEQYKAEREKEGFSSLDLAEMFQTLANQVEAKLTELTERQNALLR
jgi:hypothetical protein